MALSMRLLSCLGLFIWVPAVVEALNLLPVPKKKSDTQKRKQQPPCSLEQDAETELASLRGHHAPARAIPCRSFADSPASPITLPHVPGASLTREVGVSHSEARAGRSGSKRARASITHGVDYVSFVTGSKDDIDGEEVSSSDRLAVWVSGYPRSGSSTILSMVTAAGEARVDSRSAGTTFSVFEPCHDGDAYEPWLEAQGCGRLLEDITECDFNGIEQLWGWPNSHTTSNHALFAPSSANNLCSQSHLVAFKTVDYGHNITDWLWLMDETPQLRIIDIVRDPRGIYASWKTTEPFKTILATDSEDFYSLTEICDNFAANLDLNHGRVHHIVFEDLTADPTTAMKGVYDFLEVPFGQDQKDWVKQTFNAKDCPEPQPWEVGFSDCHEDSAVVIEKWRDVLSDDEKAEFNASPTCQKVAKQYGFPSK